MEEKSFDYMNVIPLVDVMLVLLTIVLMTSTFVASGAIPVQLPRAAHHNQPVPKSATITIDKEGTIYYESVPVLLEKLPDRLRQLEKTTAVHVRTDRTVAVQVCVDVLDQLTASGFGKVSLETERK